ncbi:sn-glycerol-3-phosphate ABC transporter ATP-binding protein UgpC [Auritidibacter ignavus]|uniref:Sn-glycerol-3-phosphate ABC transporter ATP-binding protein UgpC n=1 Tax=Auritidibacter ignavus TaxID=678932 RepID=A0AAJ6DF09_9MICC|nr:sn-glycerol-3-phosphate ABC transporter ATP-binding protein UgpC [Auritidibacter ignavus]WGH93238.1 sn-glycerol-3-phosphate ABC transporter ATP-binding protein UgpC [Auritidibacter ignavus]
MASVTYDHASRIYSAGSRPAINQLDLAIDDGEFLVLVGPSGCGKSTALRMLAGLEDVDEGRILIGGEDVSHQDAKARDIAMVFQNYALYPHMTVADNMAFSLKISGVSKSQRRAKVEKAARILDLLPYLDRKPKELSGGQRQRVAMGRAIVREPKVFLMDEPLSNLDAKLRVQTRTQIAALTRQLATTTVYVTHDQVEAMTMGDRVCVLKEGILQQVDTPRNLYDNPANVFVAGFIGSPAMNLVAARHDAQSIQLGGTTVPVAAETLNNATSDSVTVGFRPEDLHVDPTNGLEMIVELTEQLGADAHVYGTLEGIRTHQPVVVRVPGRRPPQPGDRIRVSPDPEHLKIFDAQTGLRINGPVPPETPHAELSDVEGLADTE